MQIIIHGKGKVSCDQSGESSADKVIMVICGKEYDSSRGWVSILKLNDEDKWKRGGVIIPGENIYDNAIIFFGQTHADSTITI